MGDWHDIRARLAAAGARMVGAPDDLGLTGLVTSIAGLTAVGAAAILAETCQSDALIAIFRKRSEHAAPSGSPPHAGPPARSIEEREARQRPPASQVAPSRRSASGRAE